MSNKVEDVEEVKGAEFEGEIEKCICEETAKQIRDICRDLEKWALNLLKKYPGLDEEILYSLNSRMECEVTRQWEIYEEQLHGVDPDKIEEMVEDMVDSRFCHAKEHNLGPYSPGI